MVANQISSDQIESLDTANQHLNRALSIVVVLEYCYRAPTQPRNGYLEVLAGVLRGELEEAQAAMEAVYSTKEQVQTKNPQQVVLKILTIEQKNAILDLASRYNAEIAWDAISVGTPGLPSNWIIFSVGPITVGISPEGDIHS
jgi:hypothetical protein